MTATDELRRLLDERGVEWRAGEIMTFTDSADYMPTEIDKLNVSLFNLTPAQAVDATLGRGTCRMGIERTSERIDGDEEHLLECSECGSRRWWLAHMMPYYCPDCGRKVVGA